MKKHSRRAFVASVSTGSAAALLLPSWAILKECGDLSVGAHGGGNRNGPPGLARAVRRALGFVRLGGLWVDKNSRIANIDGYRKQAVEYLRELTVPVLRWPGGCFADDYQWRDGIGPSA